MSSIKNTDMNDGQAKLSPTPRKSERDRKNVSYVQLNKGAVESEDDGGEASKNKKAEAAKKGSLAEV
jgi:hypothetical protein